MDYVGLCLVYLHFGNRLYAFCRRVFMIMLKILFLSRHPPLLKVSSKGMDEKHTPPSAKPGLVLFFLSLFFTMAPTLIETSHFTLT